MVVARSNSGEIEIEIESMLNSSCTTALFGVGNEQQTAPHHEDPFLISNDQNVIPDQKIFK